MADTSLRSFGIADETARGQWGLATLTTMPVTGYEVVDLGRIAGDATPRAAQLVTMDLPGRGPLRIANTHLTYRLLSRVQLPRLVRRLDTSDIPTVIVGDSTCPRRSPGSRRVRPGGQRAHVPRAPAAATTRPHSHQPPGHPLRRRGPPAGPASFPGPGPVRLK